mmetsp:Transcript_89434/g.148652  ORF Transcript_89434/g.148652 Transcript_89434/m.148652 type:complete len:111 (-) Transcript_89434:2043-2375(-)
MLFTVVLVPPHATQMTKIFFSDGSTGLVDLLILQVYCTLKKIGNSVMCHDVAHTMVAERPPIDSNRPCVCLLNNSCNTYNISSGNCSHINNNTIAHVHLLAALISKLLHK